MRICKLRFRNRIVLAIALAPLHLFAQDDCGTQCKINSNLAMVVSLPVSQTSEVVGTGWGLVGGAGYNFNPRNAFVGEFMWNRNSADSSLQPLRETLQGGNFSGYSDLFVLTGNYRYEVRGRLLGYYLIGGGGWYFRTPTFLKPLLRAPGPCALQPGCGPDSLALREP